MSENTKVSASKKLPKLKKEKPKNSRKSDKVKLPKSFTIWLSVIFFISGTCLIIGYNTYKGSSPEHAKSSVSTSKLQIGGPFTAINQYGRKVTHKEFFGKLSVFFFGFTYCPDICPTALSEVSDAIRLLGDKAESVTPIFVTIDPERDTPEYLKEYITYFHPSIVGLSGSMEQIKKIAKVFKVYFSKAKQKNSDSDDYVMDHSTVMYLMGRDGEYLEHFSHGISAEEMAQRIRKHL